MTLSSYRGHPILHIDGEWVYQDSLQPVSVLPQRPCGHCGKADTDVGHDGCLGTLPGIMNACCGHGQEPEAYVQLMDGACICGASALIVIEELKKIVEI